MYGCGLWEWVESMCVVSRRWIWVESMGLASGYGCKEVYRFPHVLVWLVGVVSRRRVWLVRMGGIYWCG